MKSNERLSLPRLIFEMADQISGHFVNKICKNTKKYGIDCFDECPSEEKYSTR
jgi:hypothetical protein